MRFFTLFAAVGFAAFAVAQENATSTASSTISAPTTETSISPQARCLQACGSADVCCQAACVNVPCPSQLQANATTECAAACPQGNGTAEETQQYADCQSSCISSYFLTATATTPTTASATGSSGTATAGQNDATTTGSSGSGHSTASGSSSSASATATGNGAPDTIRLGSISVGFLGLVIAGLAL